MHSFAPPRTTAAPVIDHPYFGPLRASGESSPGWLWESLDLVRTARGWADLSFVAGRDGPNDAHRRQLNAVLAQLDSLTFAAAGMISEQLHARAAELEWQGARLPGSEGAFSLYFACRNWPESLITVHFQRWKPTAVEIGD
jgi:hypothetical protein